jgi:HK97 family phage major capsid protein
MKLTNALKAYAEKHLGVKAGSGDAAYKKAVSAAVMTGALKAAEFIKLTDDKPADPPAADPPKKKAKAKPAAGAAAGLSADDVTRLVKRAVRKATKAGGLPGAAPTPDDVFGKSPAAAVRVKTAAEQYSTTTTAAVFPGRLRKDGTGGAHPLAGQPATFMGRPLDQPSELAKAVSGAWVKWCIKSSNGGSDAGIPHNLRLTDHDRDLVLYAMKNMPWTGFVRGSGEAPHRLNRKKLGEWQVKALLDDTTSGGIEITPTVFDDAIVMIPVLFGELFPFVNVVNIPKGRRIKSGAMQNPTFTSGQAEGSAITPFNTSAFVSAFDTTVHVATGAMETGLDFEEDSPVDLGSAVVEKYGDKALEWLDRVIAVGNGYNEPLGILNTTGLVAIATDNGAAGPPTVSDYEGLYFGLAKQWRNEAGAVTAYIGNDTSYRRAMGIQVGPGDERRVFGMNHAGYQMLDRPYKVQNDIPNAKTAFANLKRYRMYRRLGLTVRVETQGRALALANTKLLVLRMRYGGQMENAAAVAINNDAQS